MLEEERAAVVYDAIRHEHPDVTYASREDISLILSKGLAVTVRDKPRNPIEYFSNWLLEYDHVQKRAKEASIAAQEVAKLKEARAEAMRLEAEKKAEE